MHPRDHVVDLHCGRQRRARAIDAIHMALQDQPVLSGGVQRRAQCDTVGVAHRRHVDGVAGQQVQREQQRPERGVAFERLVAHVVVGDADRVAAQRGQGGRHGGGKFRWRRGRAEVRTRTDCRRRAATGMRPRRTTNSIAAPLRVNPA